MFLQTLGKVYAFLRLENKKLIDFLKKLLTLICLYGILALSPRESGDCARVHNK